LRKKILPAILLSVFLLSAMTVPILSQDVTVGVSVGDWFKYETRILDWIAEPDVPFPPDQYVEMLYTYNETDWQKLTVTDIAGSNVTLDVLLHWKNGTETTYELETNITSSQTPPEALTVVPANLEAGDQVKTTFLLSGVITYPPRYINETILMDYETGTRETNVLDYEHPTWAPESSIHSTTLWDKETGVLVKNYVVFLNNTSMLGYDYSVTFEIELVEANLWVIPEFPTGTAMLLIFVAITVSISILHKRPKWKRWSD
jgi:hypothetical protein